MTKVTVLNEDPQKKESKQIEFVIHINAQLTPKNKNRAKESLSDPSDWDNVVLLKKEDNNFYYDLMYAYDDDGKDSALFLGFFNGGIV